MIQVPSAEAIAKAVVRPKKEVDPEKAAKVIFNLSLRPQFLNAVLYEGERKSRKACRQS